MIESTHSYTKGGPTTMRIDPGQAVRVLLAAMVAVCGQSLRAETPVAASNSAGSGNDSANALTEIVVTATRREEAIGRVPISITAFSEDKMDDQGVKGIEDIARLTPNLIFSRSSYFSGSNTDISIRGIDSFVGAHTTGIYIDDTPMQVRGLGNSAANAYPLVFDLDRVEVLRGPQGTLFGAGAEGGAVRFISAAPSLTDYSGYARTEVASTRGGDVSYEGGVAYGGPLVNDVVGFRVSAWYRRDGGWVDRASYPTGNIVDADSNFQNSNAFKGALTVAVAPSLQVTPSIFYQEVYVNDTSGYWENLSDPSDGVFKTGYVLPQPVSDRMLLPAAKMVWTGDAVQLISNTSYFHRVSNQTRDYTNFDTEGFGSFQPYVTLPGQNAPTAMTNIQNDLTQEIRLVSRDGAARLKWVAGIFYDRNRQTATQRDVDHFINQLIETEWNGQYDVASYFGAPMLPGDVFFQDAVHSTTWQAAAFGQIDFSLTAHWKLTAGLRYADTGVSYHFVAGGPLEGGNVDQAGSHTERPLTPKFGVTYEANEHSLVYLSIAKGYRAGGAQNPQSPVVCAKDFASLGISSTPASYNSDNVWSYELGTKDTAFGGRFIVNADIFQIQWQKIQQEVYLPTCGGLYIANEGTASARGVEIETQFKPIRWLTLGLSAGYTDAKFTQTVLGGSNSILVASGEPIGNSPFNGTGSFQLDFPTGSLAAYFRGDYTYTARAPQQDSATFGYDPGLLPDPATHYLSLRTGVRIAGVNLSLFVNNVTNSEPNLSRYHLFSYSPLYTDVSFRPRTAGLTAVYRF